MLDEGSSVVGGRVLEFNASGSQKFSVTSGVCDEVTFLTAWQKALGAKMRMESPVPSFITRCCGERQSTTFQPV